MRYLESRMVNTMEKLNKASVKLDIAKDVFDATVDQNLTLYSNKLNDTMNIFACIATMFLPLQLVSGLLGMNVLVPGQNVDDTTPFWIICGVCIGLLIILLILFKSKNWF
jgi:Mg2+ and Co2+ transporter CorA